MTTRDGRTPMGRLALLMMAALFGGAVIAGCGDGEADGDDATAALAEVRAASADWDEAFNAGDLSGLMSLYGDEAVSMPYYGPALEGKATIEADFAGFFEGFDAEHATTIVGLEIGGDWAIERGQYTLSVSAKDGSESWEEAGKHIVVRRRAADGWRVVWEIWNLDDPGG